MSFTMKHYLPPTAGAILSSITEGLIIGDMDGNVLDINPAALRFLGFGDVAEGRRHFDEFQDLFEVRFPDGRRVPKDERPFARALRGDSFTDYELNLRHVQSGREIWASYAGTPVLNEANEAILVIVTFRDVTSRKLAEQALRASESQLKLVTDSSPLLISYIDREYRYLFNNAPFESWYGRTLDEIWGRHVWSLIGPTEYMCVLPLMEAALRGRKVAHERTMAHHDGSMRTVEVLYVPDKDSEGNTRGFVSLINDITTRVRAEQAMRESEALKGAILEAALDCIITIDDRQRVVEWNPASEATFGYSRQDVLGKELSTLIIPDRLKEAHVQGFARYLSTRQAKVLNKRIEMTARHADGNEFPVELTVLPITVGGHTLFTAYLRDITERKKAVAQQRAFFHDVLLSVTDGKLHLCSIPSDLPQVLGSRGDPIELSMSAGLSALRHAARNASQELGFSDERWQDLITAVSEAGMNAVMHAGGGIGFVTTDGDGIVQVWIEDHGSGIDVHDLPRAAFEKGYSTAGTLGHGMKIMLEMCDRLWLLTGQQGTTVVLEQEKVRPEPEWKRLDLLKEE